MYSENFNRLARGIIFSAMGIYFIFLSFFVVMKFSEFVFLIISATVILIGLLFLFSGAKDMIKFVILKRNDSILKRESIKIKGKVVDYKPIDFRVNRTKLYRLIVKGEDGRFYESQGDSYEKLSEKYNINDEIEILLYPKDKQIYKVITF